MLAIGLVIVAMVAGSSAQCTGTPNNLPIWNGAPTFVTSVANGSLYVADAQQYNQLPVMHLYGTPYDFGFAHGLLMKEKIVAMIPQFIEYMDSQVAQFFQWLPKDIQVAVETAGVEGALKLIAKLTAPYTPAHFTQELQGLADALDGAVSYEMLLELNMFPELIKAHCTIIGAWGPAIATCTEVNLSQLRALDFGMDTPLGPYHVLAVYHPLSGNGHTFASLTWTGFIGSITAYSGIMGVSEKVWLAYNKTQNNLGIPFHYLLRDIAQYDLTVDDSLNRIYNVQRTCSIWIGLGSNYTNQLRVVNYGFEEVFVWDDRNYPAYLPAHPLLEGVVYVDKHRQPSNDPCLGSLVQQYYGSLNANNVIRNIVGPFQTGDLHAAFYSFGDNQMYVSITGVPILANGTAILNGTLWPAYDRPWFQFNMNNLFAQGL